MATSAQKKPAAQSAIAKAALEAKRANARLADLKAKASASEDAAEDDEDAAEATDAADAAADDDTSDDDDNEDEDDATRDAGASAKAIAKSPEAKSHPHLATAAIASGQSLKQFKATVAALADQPKGGRLDARMSGAPRLGPDASKPQGSANAMQRRAAANRERRSTGA